MGILVKMTSYIDLQKVENHWIKSVDNSVSHRSDNSFITEVKALFVGEQYNTRLVEQSTATAIVDHCYMLQSTITVTATVTLIFNVIIYFSFSYSVLCKWDDTSYTHNNCKTGLPQKMQQGSEILSMLFSISQTLH